MPLILQIFPIFSSIKSNVLLTFSESRSKLGWGIPWLFWFFFLRCHRWKGKVSQWGYKKINKARLWSTLSQDFQSDHTGTITNLRKTQNLKLWLTCRESTWLWRRGRSARWDPWGSSCLPQQLGNKFLVYEYIMHIWIYLDIFWVQEQISIYFEYVSRPAGSSCLPQQLGNIGWFLLTGPPLLSTKI